MGRRLAMSGIQGFSSLDSELELQKLPVTGLMPEWLSGTLVRNGPAKFEVGKQSYRHWFDGLGMLHKFSFQNGEVTYANRFLRSQAYQQAMKSGKITFSEFATDPCRSLFGRVLSVFFSEFTDNANVNVTRIADRFVAMTETPMSIEFDPQTLKTLGVFKYEDDIKGNLTTAHPHFDFVRKEVLNYVTRFSRISSYDVYRLPASGKKRRLIGSIPVKEPGYMHSFGITQNYVILTEFPLVVNPLDLLLKGKPFIENFRWKPEKGTRFLVIDRNNGKLIREYETESFFAFHHVNAFEHDGKIFLDIVAYRNASVIDAFYLAKMKANAGPIPLGKLRRFHIPLHGGTGITSKWISDVAIELPRIHYEQRNTKDYQFVYGIGTDRPTEFSNQLVKLNIQNGIAKTWFEENSYPGEPVFVRKPDAKDEDEGVILSVVLNANKGNSFLLVLDAGSFEEIARAEVPHSIPFGFHGQFFEDVSTTPAYAGA
jgi:beta,beta-carotene 9',10'-dioxygenase